MSDRFPAVALLALLMAAIVSPGAGLARAAATDAKPAADKKDARRGPVDFQREIQPLFADTCYTCHGPDSAKRKSALRLDSRKGAFVDLGGYQAILPGQPDKSALYERITSKDPDERMPPPTSGRQLTAQQIELLRRWIAEGAPWKDHWSFIPPQRPPLPMVKNAGWVRNPIDQYVLAALEHEGLAPSPEASKETLIRRVTLDLTGLPPTVAEVDAFLADKSPDAYDKLIDRLLASPRYGEHMASEWLDAARYSDTNGYQGDATRTMWPWRDWVIDAMNHNMPFDQFTIEQLAGDLLPHPTESQLLATGFNRNHPLNGEGGAIPEEFRVEYVIDRVSTTATVWLGLTAGCARCHDHKYDPISQREFYQLFAFFNNVTETGGVDLGGNASPVMTLKRPDKQLDQIRAEIASLEKQVSRDSAELDAAQAKWEAEEKVAKHPVPTLGGWRSLGPFVAANERRAYEKNFGPEGKPVPGEKFAGRKWKEEKYVDGKPTPLNVPPNSAFYLVRSVKVPQPAAMDVSLGSDDGIQVWLNGQRVLAHDVKRGVAPDQEYLRLKLKAGTNWLLMKINNATGQGGFYFSAELEDPPANLRAILAIAPQRRTTAQRDQVRTYYRRVAPELEPIRSKLETLRQQEPQVAEAGTIRTMIMQERPKPRATYVLTRGQYDAQDLKQKVTPDVPACLPPLKPDAPRNRLGLARWLVDPANPLTARVTVNRYWQQFFGIALVKTTEDFGSQGELPSNSDLLDYLATEFVARHWDVKALHRLIVTSATYRQSSHVTPEQLDRDLFNRLLGRGPRIRLSSYALRDQALMLGGLLVEKVGGPPVKPYQPAGVWLDFSLGQIGYTQDHGESLYRRSIYTFWRRSVAPTMLFDISSRQVCTVRQVRTDTPLHALTLLNDVTYVEAARGLAQRVMLAQDAAPRSRLDRAFRMATARHATPQELSLLERSLERATRQFRADPAAAGKLLAVGESVRSKKLDPVELAAYTSVMNVILNLDEVLTKE